MFCYSNSHGYLFMSFEWNRQPFDTTFTVYMADFYDVIVFLIFYPLNLHLNPLCFSSQPLSQWPVILSQVILFAQLPQGSEQFTP